MSLAPQYLSGLVDVQNMSQTPNGGSVGVGSVGQPGMSPFGQPMMSPAPNYPAMPSNGPAPLASPSHSEKVNRILKAKFMKKLKDVKTRRKLT